MALHFCVALFSNKDVLVLEVCAVGHKRRHFPCTSESTRLESPCPSTKSGVSLACLEFTLQRATILSFWPCSLQLAEDRWVPSRCCVLSSTIISSQSWRHTLYLGPWPWNFLEGVLPEKESFILSCHVFWESWGFSAPLSTLASAVPALPASLAALTTSLPRPQGTLFMSISVYSGLEFCWMYYLRA